MLILVVYLLSNTAGDALWRCRYRRGIWNRIYLWAKLKLITDFEPEIRIYECCIASGKLETGHGLQDPRSVFRTRKDGRLESEFSKRHAADMKSASPRATMISTELLDLINKFSSDSVKPFTSKMWASLFRYFFSCFIVHSVSICIWSDEKSKFGLQP